MEKAKHALMVHAVDLVTREILSCCLNLVEKGIALELFLDKENKVFLEENPFILNKCFQLINKGGSIFLVSHKEELRFWKCVIDFKEFSYYSIEEDKVIHENDQDLPVFQKAFLDFERKKQESESYLVEKGDIQIRFSVSERLIMAGDLVELKWEVDGADKVIIQGIGEVQAYGRKTISLKADTILKIGATSEKQSQIKAVLVRVFEGDIKISYDIGFTKVGTTEYRSLVNSSNYPHVYGVSEGNLVKLTWNVPKATEVKVMPFNLIEATGVYIFTPSASLTIEIHATISNRTFIRKIQILLFPIPLFKEKLISLYKSTSENRQGATVGISKERNEEIYKEERQRYLVLTKTISDLYLAIDSEKINLKSAHGFLFNVLKGRFSRRKGILDEIRSIQAYYERPQSGRGTDKSSF